MELVFVSWMSRVDSKDYSNRTLQTFASNIIGKLASLLFNEYDSFLVMTLISQSLAAKCFTILEFLIEALVFSGRK